MFLKLLSLFEFLDDCIQLDLLHTVFNAGLGISWKDNMNELRYFTSINTLISYLQERGFIFTGKKLLQKNDPSDNTLLEFIKAY